MIMLSTSNKVRTTKLTKALLTAGLLGGASLSVLSAGSASAATCPESTLWTDAFNGGSPFPCTLGDKQFDKFSTNIPSIGTSAIEIQQTGDLWDVNANFDPAASLSVNDYYEYEVKINESSQTFGQAFLAWITNPPSTSGVKKEIFNVSTGALLGGITDNGGSFTFGPNVSNIRVRDTITVAGSYDNISNNLSQVPGPLPLFGAGAAFGFSRRIRSRIKKAHLA
ncbi:MAG: hypothetical protein WAM11_04595 [Cyanobium sp.]